VQLARLEPDPLLDQEASQGMAAEIRCVLGVHLLGIDADLVHVRPQSAPRDAVSHDQRDLDDQAIEDPTTHHDLPP
jgi:hypothetical protein